MKNQTEDKRFDDQLRRKALLHASLGGGGVYLGQIAGDAAPELGGELGVLLCVGLEGLLPLPLQLLALRSELAVEVTHLAMEQPTQY